MSSTALMCQINCHASCFNLIRIHFSDTCTSVSERVLQIKAMNTPSIKMHHVNMFKDFFIGALRPP